jgi:hypothetical protein
MSNQSKKRSKQAEPALPAEVIGALADKFGKSYLTMQRWVEKKDDRLTTDKAKEVFAEKNIVWS